MTEPHTASARAITSYFADLQADPRATRVCRGLSCAMSGADRLAASIDGPTRDVYCLGYCDRSPVALRPGGELLTLSETPAATALPQIRCRARDAVVTGRLAGGACRSLDDARAAGLYADLGEQLRRQPADMIGEIESSGEQGRGGAAFPTGRKWRACAARQAARRYIVANGDEGDPGSYIDRLLMEYDPHALIESLILAGHAIGAEQGVIYVRGEYPGAVASLQRALAEARGAGLLGEDVAGTGLRFEIELAVGKGSYVCGEETALLNAVEGKRGEVRVRPPYPVTSGLHGYPTVVDNVETLVNAGWILRHGAQRYRAMGTPGSPGTKAICLNHGFPRPGVVEVEFGTELAELIHTEGGSAPGELAGVALGGPMGSILLPDEWRVPLDYRVMAARGIQLGHGGLVALPGDVDFMELARDRLRFMASESCGKCLPCREGSAQALSFVENYLDSANKTLKKLDVTDELLNHIATTSLCGFGRGIPPSVRRLLALGRQQRSRPDD